MIPIFSEPWPAEAIVNDSGERRPVLLLGMFDNSTFIACNRDGMVVAIHREDVRLLWRWDDELKDWIDVSEPVMAAEDTE